MIPTTQPYKRLQTSTLQSLETLITQVYEEISRTIRQLARQDGTIPPNRLKQLTDASDRAILNLMVGGHTNPITPTQGLSPFTALLMSSVSALERQMLEIHQKFLRERLSADTVQWLESATTSEAPTYQNIYNWVAPNGRTANERVWSQTFTMREKVNRYLTFNILAGATAFKLLRELESVLSVTKPLAASVRPLGVNAGSNARLLMQSEIARSYADFGIAISADNPAVEGIEWVLSPRHPRRDVCDRLATVGMRGERLKPPYNIADAPRVVTNSHPLCICTNEAADDLTALNALENRQGLPMWTILAAGYAAWVLS